ncbi:MAG: hypothetical protein IGR76_02540 [Synechococcales cyanobacterium T60_A2020_003]|nr:hypothetical protein [Synechococcales cyanobacterium T60_A2020_003]
MKYFFLTEDWTIGRVWGTNGLWDDAAWRRSPEIYRMNICITENSERLWLHRVEDVVLMLEVRPDPVAAANRQTSIGQVMLKRLISAEQVLELLAQTGVVNPEAIAPSVDGTGSS